MEPKELKAWRKEHDFSQSQLARELEVVTMTISRWERGERGIPAFLPLALESIVARREVNKAKGKAKIKPKRG